MTKALYAVPLLAGPVAIGLLMSFMMRGERGASPDDSAAPGEAQHLRSETERSRTPQQQDDATTRDAVDPSDEYVI
ncbi:hypothetical protein [Pseudarthrobacter cellobiosi]|uniref:hypothetical protein n=1 Tax=Pseudarthrobacter cellobiosi TaxID=2953654 RepID=UPI00208EDBDF|nr:hypothetical protein [Pseudarthrobacter sp. HLT1-5]MCO4254489.1 hypothetical protein [Pseudarthrobacter sp. HLT1-5]